MLNIVLVEPEIPQNCGNIARTCAATGCRLHLIRPLGFDISEKAVKRAGLDYWNLVDVGDGWYHMDCTPRANNYTDSFFLFTDEEMLAYSRKHKNGNYCAWVQPTLFPVGEPEAAVPVNYNHITLVGTVSGRQSFFGQGAGRWPTAYNVVQDCVDFLHGNGFYTTYGEKITVNNEDQLSYYVRGAAWPKDRTEEYWDDDAVITTPVSVAQMHARLKENPTAFIAAMPRH